MGMFSLFLNSAFSKAKLNFLSGASMQSMAQSLGINATNTNQIGNSLIPAIQHITELVSLIAAVGVVSIIAVLIITSKRAEARSEALTRIIWVGLGLAIALLAVGLVGYLVTVISGS